MDTNHVDNLLHSLRSALSRRNVVAGLTGGLLAAGIGSVQDDDAEAKKKRKRKKKRKNKKRDKPVTRADASCSPSSGARVGSDANGRFAQTFTAIASGPLVRAELVIEQEAGSFGDYRLQLGTVDGFGVPTNEVLAVTTLGSASVPIGISTVPFDFAKPFSVVAGTEYALVLTRSVSDFIWQGRLADPCAGQTFASPDQTAPFAPLNNVGNEFDFAFTTFVES